MVTAKKFILITKITESWICFQHLCLAAESIDLLFSHRCGGKTNRKKSKKQQRKTKNEDKTQKVQECGKGFF